MSDLPVLGDAAVVAVIQIRRMTSEFPQDSKLSAGGLHYTSITVFIIEAPTAIIIDSA